MIYFINIFKESVILNDMLTQTMDKKNCCQTYIHTFTGDKIVFTIGYCRLFNT
nr:hypothetical protein Datr000025 [Darna trima granulovirus]